MKQLSLGSETSERRWPVFVMYPFMLGVQAAGVFVCLFCDIGSHSVTLLD